MGEEGERRKGKECICGLLPFPVSLFQLYPTNQNFPARLGCIPQTRCAALREAEINAEIIFKATNVDGVYDKDPNKFDDAVKYDVVTHTEVLEKNLKVMDSTAASLWRDNNISILVFNLEDPENIVRAILGENIGTIVKEG